MNNANDPATANGPASSQADPKSTRLLGELKHDRGVLVCRFDRQGRSVFAGAQDHLVHRWVLGPDGGEPQKTSLAGHESWVQAMALTPDGSHLATGDYVGRLMVWPTQGDELLPRHTIDAHTGSIRAVAASPDGKLLASAGNDGAVRLWSIDKGDRVLELSGHGCHVYHTAFHPDGKSLVSADLKGVVRHWDLSSGKLVRQLDAGPLWMYSERYTVDVGGVRGMTFNADGTRLACAGATGDKGIAHSGNPCVLLFDWESGKLLRHFRAEKEVIATAWGVRFHPGGFLIGSGGSRTGGYLWFWQPDADTEVHLFPFKSRGPGFDVDLSPDGTTLAVAHHDGAVRLYSLTPAEPPKAKATSDRTSVRERRVVA